MNRSKIQAATLILAALFIIILFPGTRANADVVDSGICGDNITWALDSEGILTIQGSGKMKNWNIITSDHSPWYKRADVKTVVIGKGVTSIGNGAFAWCEKLESITIPDSITSIGNYAFYFCFGVKEITIPDSVTSIGNRAFYGCSRLKEITIPDSVTSIGEYAFYGCSELKEITIPDSITSIGEGTFAFCKNLKSITIPDSVTSIGNRAFYGCSGLKEITIPDSVTSIGEYAFNDCSSLKKIVFPDKESYAFVQSCFARCTSIETVIVNSEAELDSVVFSDCPSSFEFYYYYDVIYSAENGTVEGKSRSYAGDILELDITPDENYIVDKVTLNGNEILSDENGKYICTMPDSEDSVTIEATFMPGGKCGENVTWKFDSEGTLTISGNGKMEDYDKDLYSTTTAPWSTFQYSVESVVIEDGVTYIGKYAFSKMGIKEATIPGSVKAIGYAAFTSAGLEKITIQEGVEWIDSQAFTGCYFEELVIPNSVSHIGDYAFYICGNIKEIIIPDNVTRLNMATFSSCNNLAKVIIPDNPDFQIHFNAFSNCGKLESIVINSEAKKNTEAFENVSEDIFHYYYSVQYSAENGSVTGKPRSYGGDSLELDVTPDANYIVDTVTLNGNEILPDKDGKYICTMPDSEDAVEFNVTFKLKQQEVTFCIKDGDKTIELQKSNVDMTTIPEYKGSDPTKDPTEEFTYTFIGWTDGEKFYKKDKALPVVTKVVTYTAVFEPTANSYEITFLDADDNVLQSGKYEYGQTPSFSETPTKKNTAEYTYTFVGWAKENSSEVLDPLPDVTGDATYHPIFSDTVNEYEITFLDEDGTELQSGKYEYGTTPSFNGIPTKPADDKFTYTFTGWTPELTEVTGDANYVATYSAKAKPIPIDPDPIITPIPIPVTSVNPEVAASFEAFVERLYEVALDRESDPDGKAYWTNQVIEGNLTGADCIREFLLSEEFNNRNLSDEEFVTVLYKALFDRDAADDPEGFNFWMNSLKTVGRDNVVDGFINSTEWCNVCATYGVKSGATRAKATTASKNATEFATRLYTECLGREPDEGGLNYWSLALTNLDITGTEAARGFFFSDEFNSANVNNKELITKMYKTLLGREADGVGLAFWIKEMDNGMTKEQLFEDFSTSPEFTGICISYAIDR